MHRYNLHDRGTTTSSKYLHLPHCNIMGTSAYDRNIVGTSTYVCHMYFVHGRAIAGRSAICGNYPNFVRCAEGLCGSHI